MKQNWLMEQVLRQKATMSQARYAEQMAALRAQAALGHLEDLNGLAGEAVITHPQPAPVVMPEAPEKVAIQISDEVTPEYIALAERIGYSTPEVAKQRLLAFLLAEGYSTYNYERVKVYMNGLVRKISDDRRADMELAMPGMGYIASTVEWYWRPLRQRDALASVYGGGGNLQNSLAQAQSQGASERHTPYDKPIPMPVLLTVAAIAEKLPDARFYVTDYAERKPDPFLGIMLPGMAEVIVLERWQEPAFR